MTPAANFFGTDTFTYRITDLSGHENKAVVTVTVDPVNDTPVILPIGDQITNIGQSIIGLPVLLEDPEPLLHHGEVIWRDGRRVGYVRVGAWGFTLGAAVGLGMVEAGEPVDRRYVESARWEIEIAGKRHGARASLQPLYDPQLARVRV